ncbi:MAG: BrnA antitoxin family protein [Desulfamplus sp.]|nr:BrnA antitoxin family protein [Desulfamplus sp.]
MTKKEIVRYNSEELKNLEICGGDKTDWNRVSSMKDEDIVYDEDSPEITEDMFDKAFICRQTKTEIRLLLDSDVMEWYKKQNISYQPLVNALLRSYMDAHH